MRSEPEQLQYLKLLLRIGGVVTGSAFFAMLLPVEWMASTHERLGMGTFPQVPVVDYLARSVAAFYGFHGVLLFVVAHDPVRLRPIVTYLAAFNIIFGVLLIAIDMHAGMPAWWTIAEGPVVIVIGILITILRRWL